jgi:hypothetical protein
MPETAKLQASQVLKSLWQAPPEPAISSFLLFSRIGQARYFDISTY